MNELNHNKFASIHIMLAIMQSKPKTNYKDLEIYKMQVDDIILPWGADGVQSNLQLDDKQRRY